jgi:hypothetical protein
MDLLALWGVDRRGDLMRRLIVVSAATILAAVIPLKAVAQAPTRVNGGGTGTFAADLDGDGDIDGSQFALHVALLGSGAARGHFMCLMAGRSDILGLPVMKVDGPVTEGALNADGSVTFAGVGTVNLGHGDLLRGVAFEVRVTAGGPGSGTMQLTVVGAFEGVPGDAVLGNGNYDLPIETVRSGQIRITSS